ncbi:DUF1257 domain-containing protein [Micromonospora sp. NPDC006766]|uniref:DUF1257 domain-containing protein n=1 Tax=Micromonospora sp. NPDC006766 TaxID=3154778 RepID=UPI0033D253B9
MSHFTRVRTRLVDERTIRGALARMGYEVLPPGNGVHGWRGQKADAAFKVRPAGTKYEIGFVPESGRGFTVVADWWGVDVLPKDAFMQRLTREYALVGTVSALAEQGFEVQEQVEKESGEIRVVLRRVGA